MTHQALADPVVAGLARTRQTLLKHATELVPIDDPAIDADRAPETISKLAALLVASLEELKVAEEELVERTTTLADLRHAREQQTREAMMLFDLAPAALIVTDCQGNIAEANHAALALFRQRLAEIERQPISRFIQQQDRRDFRQALALVVATESVEGWRFLLARLTDSPIPVSATVAVIRSATGGQAARLYWRLDVVNGEQPPPA